MSEVTLSPGRAALAAAALAALVAAPSIRNGFVLDDTVIVQHRQLLREPPSLEAVLRAPYWAGAAASRGYIWRPAVFASYALDYRLSASPHWFHAVNVVWAAAAAGLLTLFAAGLLGPRIGLVAGLLFAVHPVHVEATANIVGRAELMAAAGFAAALLFAARSERSLWGLAGVALASAFAIASKEHAGTLPAVILVAGAVRGEGGIRRSVVAAAVAALPIGIYWALREPLAGVALGSGGTPPGFELLNGFQRAWAMVPITLEWWRLLLFPLRLSADYSPGEVRIATGVTLWHLVAVLLWAGAGWAAWRWRRQVPGAALGLAWVVITILPVSNLLVPVELVVAERTLFLPSLGAALALASLWVLPTWSPRTAWAVLAVVLLAGAVRSVSRAGVWRDEARFQAALERDAPRSAFTLWLQGRRAFDQGRWGTGERLMREAIAVSPNAGAHIEDLAGAYAAAGVWPPVVSLMRHEMAVDSGYSIPWVHLPKGLLETGDTAAAARLGDQAARRFPDNPSVLRASVPVLVAAGWCGSARWAAGRLGDSSGVALSACQARR